MYGLRRSGKNLDISAIYFDGGTRVEVNAINGAFYCAAEEGKLTIGDTYANIFPVDDSAMPGKIFAVKIYRGSLCASRIEG